MGQHEGGAIFPMTPTWPGPMSRSVGDLTRRQTLQDLFIFNFPPRGRGSKSDLVILPTASRIVETGSWI